MNAVKRPKAAGAERRRFPRVSGTVPVVLESSKGKTVTGLMHNLSPGGMQVRLSSEAADALLAGKGRTGQGQKFSVQARFVLPLRKTRVPITVKTDVVHVFIVDSAPAAARVAVGFRLKRFKDSNSLRRFVMYLEEQMVPLEDYELYLNGPAAARGKTSKTQATPA